MKSRCCASYSPNRFQTRSRNGIRAGGAGGQLSPSGCVTRIVLADGTCRTVPTASVLQALGFRGDVTVFRLNATARGQSGSEPAFRRNRAAPVYTIEAAVNRRVVGSSPTRGVRKGPGNRAFLLSPVAHNDNVASASASVRSPRSIVPAMRRFEWALIAQQVVERENGLLDIVNAGYDVDQRSPHCR